MNKRELFEAVIELPVDCSGSRPKIDKLTTLELIKLLKEPEKVKIPQFVADWYEEHKDNLEYNIWDWMKYNLEPKKRENVIFSQWFVKTVNNPVETLIKMKLFGYEVEKEKRYRVEMKGISSLFRHLKYNLLTEKWYMGNDTENEEVKKTHTRKEIEDGGFGEVFNSPLFEVYEVEE